MLAHPRDTVALPGGGQVHSHGATSLPFSAGLSIESPSPQGCLWPPSGLGGVAHFEVPVEAPLIQGPRPPPAHTPRKGTRDVERNWPVMWGQVGGLSLHREVTRLEALHIAHRWSLVEAPGQPRRLKTASLDTSSGAPGAGSHVLPGELSITCETISVGLAHPSSSPAPDGEYFFVGGSGG